MCGEVCCNRHRDACDNAATGFDQYHVPSTCNMEERCSELLHSRFEGFDRSHIVERQHELYHYCFALERSRAEED